MTAPRGPKRSGRTDRDDRPVLPEVTEDEHSVGWGDDRHDREDRDEAWYRRERPPHHE